MKSFVIQHHHVGSYNGTGLWALIRPQHELPESLLAQWFDEHVYVILGVILRVQVRPGSNLPNVRNAMWCRRKEVQSDRAGDEVRHCSAQGRGVHGAAGHTTLGPGRPAKGCDEGTCTAKVPALLFRRYPSSM